MVPALSPSQSKLAGTTQEKDFLKQLSDNLLSNQRELQERIRVLETSSREASGSQDAQIKVRPPFCSVTCS